MLVTGGDYANLPHTRAYLDSLPAGLDSYPDATVKGSLVRALVERVPPAVLESDLPPEIRRLYDEPPLVSDWVPEVRLTAMAKVARDLAFDSDEGLQGFVREGLTEVFGGPLYRIVFALVSPTRLAKSGTKRWSAIVRGTKRELLEINENGNLGVIRYEPHLYDESICRLVLEALMVAYGLSRAPNPQGHLLEWTPTSAKLEVIYDRSRPRGPAV